MRRNQCATFDVVARGDDGVMYCLRCVQLMLTKRLCSIIVMASMSG